jgi:hypothetical protein
MFTIWSCRVSTFAPLSHISACELNGNSEFGITGPEAKSRDEPVTPGSGTHIIASHTALGSNVIALTGKTDFCTNPAAAALVESSVL